MSRPKTLAERLDWMARNLPGFAQELQDVAAIERRATHECIRQGFDGNATSTISNNIPGCADDAETR